jgi:hypothetical protein
MKKLFIFVSLIGVTTLMSQGQQFLKTNAQVMKEIIVPVISTITSKEKLKLFNKKFDYWKVQWERERGFKYTPIPAETLGLRNVPLIPGARSPQTNKPPTTQKEYRRQLMEYQMRLVAAANPFGGQAQAPWKRETPRLVMPTPPPNPRIYIGGITDWVEPPQSRPAAPLVVAVPRNMDSIQIAVSEAGLKSIIHGIEVSLKNLNRRLEGLRRAGRLKEHKWSNPQSKRKFEISVINTEHARDTAIKSLEKYRKLLKENEGKNKPIILK